MEETARKAYTAYKAYIDAIFVPQTQLPLPPWDSLSETHRNAWVAAVSALTVPDRTVGYVSREPPGTVRGVT